MVNEFTYHKFAGGYDVHYIRNGKCYPIGHVKKKIQTSGSNTWWRATQDGIYIGYMYQTRDAAARELLNNTEL